MNFCINCGKKIDSSAYACPHCGIRLKEEINNQSNNISVDDGGFVWGILGFFVPLVGLILYLTWKKDRPKTAKIAGIGALVSVSLQILLCILGAILAFNITNSIINEREDYYYNDYYNYDNDLKFE